MTDGEQSCSDPNGGQGYDITDKAVVDRILKTKARIVTVAFR